MASQNGARAAGGGAAMNKKILASVREATGASEDEIQFMLTECNGDVNEAVTRLLDNPFEQVPSKKDRRPKPSRTEGGSGGGRRGGDIPGSQGYGNVKEVKRGGYGGDRGGRGGGGGRGGSRDRPSSAKPTPSGPKPGGQASARPAPAAAPQAQAAPAARPAPAAGAPTPVATNPPPIRPAAPGTAAKSFTDILRKDPNPPPAPAPVPAYTVAPSSPAPAPAAPAPAAPEPQAPIASAPMTGQTFAEKLAAANIAQSQPPVQPPPKQESAPIQPPISAGAYQPPQTSTETPAADVSSSTWGPPSAQSPTSLQNSGLAGLLSGNTEESDKSSLMPPDVASAADSLGLQFGQFGMGGTGMGDFGAGFGAGFGDDLGAADEAVPAPGKTQDTTEASDANTYSATADGTNSYQPAPTYNYGQPASTAMASSLTQPPKPSDAATVPPAASQFPSPYYGQPGVYPHVAPQPPPPAPQGTPYTQYGGNDNKAPQQPGLTSQEGYQYGQQGRSDEFPATSAPAPAKYGQQSGQRQDGFNSQDPPTSSAAAASSAPAAPVQPPVPQQMPAFPNPGMPPGMAPQYGYLHHQYPYMHNANMYMYPNPYPHYGAGGAYPPQAGNTSFPPSVGSSAYPNQMSAGGPKYSYPYAQTTQTPLSSGLAPGGYSYSSPSGYTADDSSTGGTYSKDSKDNMYGSSGNQQHGGQQMPRDSPYAGYNMPGQGYQQQGYNAGAQGQYGGSAYAAQYMQQYTQMPPNMTGQGQGGSQSSNQSGGYKLQ